MLNKLRIAYGPLYIIMLREIVSVFCNEAFASYPKCYMI